MKIIVPEFVLDEIQAAACELVQACEFVTVGSQGVLCGEIAGAEVLMLPFEMPPALLDAILALPTLRWVHTVSAGVDHALGSLQQRPDVLFTNARGVFDAPIAETVLAYILMIAKRMPELLAQQREQRWKLLPLREVAGLSVGLIGLGGIGGEIARRCQALGMRVVATRRRPELPAPYVDVLLPTERLAELLGRVDFVVVAVPLTPETTGMIGATELAHIRPEAWFINIARGAVVDEAALIDALTAGRISGAALDVFAEEPLPPESPLWTLPNVILTPHNSWSTPRVNEREAQLFMDNLERYLRGEALRNVVDRTLGY